MANMTNSPIGLNAYVFGNTNIGPVAHRTRAALEEIPRHGTTAIGLPSTQPQIENLPGSYISSLLSPDELIIRSRGRRSHPIEWSPIPVMESPQKRHDHTPVKNSARKSLIVVRSSPRKRLQMNDSSPAEILENRRLMMQMSPVVKKCRSMSVSPAQSPPEVAIKGLSQSQLVNVLGEIIHKHPELKDEISNILPTPDLRQMEEKLNLHKKSIFKALPTSRLASKTDSPAFTKASPHLIAFKKSLQDQGMQLVEAHQWNSLVEYCLLAWSYVRATPVWDSPNHNNNYRKSCFKILVQFCLQGLENVAWSNDEMENMLKKLEQCRQEHEDVDQCIEYAKNFLGNSQY